jgi:phage anti-repressor protein
LATHTKMPFKDFVIFNNIDLNTIMVDKIFHNIRNDMPIYMDEAMIEYFGYSGDLDRQRKSLIRLINDNFSEYQNQLWHSYKNKEYIEFCEKTKENLKGGQPLFKNNDENLEISSLYPTASTGKSASRIKHLLISPKLFKEMLMLAQTDKGKQVRRYYIDMMEVMEIYIKFQNTVQIESLNVQLADIKLMLTNSEKNRIEAKAESEKHRIEAKAVEEKQSLEIRELLGYAKETKDELKETNTTLKEVAKQRVEIDKLDLKKHPKFIILKDPNDDQMPYYAIRRQQESIQDAIDEIMEKYPDLKLWLRIPQPNAVAFFNIIKKELGQYMIRDGNWFGLKDIEPSDFKKRIKALNKKRSNPIKKTL